VKALFRRDKSTDEARRGARGDNRRARFVLVLVWGPGPGLLLMGDFWVGR
jgi:hypothetical protein